MLQTVHSPGGSVSTTESYIDLINLDYRGIRPITDAVPAFREFQPIECKGMYCSRPAYLPILHMIELVSCMLYPAKEMLLLYLINKWLSGTLLESVLFVVLLLFISNISASLYWMGFQCFGCDLQDFLHICKFASLSLFHYFVLSSLVAAGMAGTSLPHPLQVNPAS